MGVNIRGYGTASERQQNDLIEQLHKSGVTTIRESLPTNRSWGLSFDVLIPAASLVIDRCWSLRA